MKRLSSLLEDIVEKDLSVFRDEAITEDSILLEAAKEPADFIGRVLENLGFPAQYTKWASLKLAKDFKELLSRRDGLNRNDLKRFAYNDADISSYEDMKQAAMARTEARNLFANTWQERYQDSLISIRDWIVGSNAEEPDSFESTVKTVAGGRLEQLKLRDASIKAQQWHDSLGSPADDAESVPGDIVEDKEVVKVYDEYYWIDNQSNTCSREDGIGCGTDRSADTIFTLKKRSNRQPVVSVSVSYSDLINKYKQAKGRSIVGDSVRDNVKPDAEYFPYIEDLFLMKDISGYSDATSHMKQNDFHPDDITNPELKKKFAEAKEKMEAKIREMLGSKDADTEGVEINDDSVTIAYKPDFQYLNQIVTHQDFDIQDILESNFGNAENSDVGIEEIWDDMAEYNVEQKYSDIEEDYKDHLNILRQKMKGGIYEYEGELYMYGTPEEQKLKLERFNRPREGVDRDYTILSYLVDQMKVSGYFDLESDDFKDYKKRAFEKFNDFKVSDESLTRLYDIKKEYDAAAYDTLVRYPMESALDNYDNLYAESMAAEDIGIEVDYSGVVLTLPLEKLINIIEEEESKDIKVAVSDYIYNNDLGASLYAYEPELSSEAPYLINNVMGGVSQLADINLDKPDHKDQLYFQGMKNESFDRIKDLAGLNG